jgi:sulfur carrier protein ThiS
MQPGTQEQPFVFYVEIVDAVRVNVLNEHIKWLRVAEIPTVADLKKMVEIEETIVVVTYRGRLLKDSDRIQGVIEYGDILDVQIKVNFNRSLEYVSHDKQNILDLIFSVWSNSAPKEGKEAQEITMESVI